LDGLGSIQIAFFCLIWTVFRFLTFDFSGFALTILN
jgi:hypothetical protein